MANEVYSATAKSISGLQVQCESRGFSFTLDEPKNLGGSNVGMNPVEALLSSLGACKVIVARSFARIQRIKLNDIRVEVRGILDPDGFRGLNKNAKIGFSEITCDFYIDADNTDQEIKDFVAFIDITCPVADTLVNSPKVITNIIN